MALKLYAREALKSKSRKAYGVLAVRYIKADVLSRRMCKSLVFFFRFAFRFNVSVYFHDLCVEKDSVLLKCLQVSDVKRVASHMSMERG